MINVHPHSAAGAPPVATGPGDPFSFSIRTAMATDAAAIDALIGAHQAEGHLLPRQVDEIRARAARFVVADADGAIKACAELVPLSKDMAEVRSLVVSAGARGHGLAARLVGELRNRARAAGFRSLLALAHDPRFFVRHDFSIVPHEWLTEKIARDCASCPLFRRCGQHAMLLPLIARTQSDESRITRHPAAAVA